MFKGRQIIIATKHKKEEVISPLLEKTLGVNCFIPDGFDTDQFGTFSGEIERKDDPINTIRAKCLHAMKSFNFDLGIASEGSFGSHPSLYFVPADDELLIFIDKNNNLEIIVREISTETNFNGEIINNKLQLKAFADKVQFPTHAIIAKKTKDDFSEIEKGINSWDKLMEVFDYFTSKYESVYMETDMRALYNPTRMKVIEKATLKLVDKINSYCPNCNTPGFGIVDYKIGLPCEECDYPTNSTLSHIYTCVKCAYSKEQKFPNGKNTENPMYCDRCNP